MKNIRSDCMTKRHWAWREDGARGWVLENVGSGGEGEGRRVSQ